MEGQCIGFVPFQNVENPGSQFLGLSSWIGDPLCYLPVGEGSAPCMLRVKQGDSISRVCPLVTKWDPNFQLCLEFSSLNVLRWPEVG